MIEKLFFNVIAFALFIIIFFIMVRKNNSNYVVLLSVQALGIAINFIELNFKIDNNMFFKSLQYIFAIIIPLAIVLLEKRKILDFSDIVIRILNLYYNITNQEDKLKDMLFKMIEKSPDSYLGHKLLAEYYEKTDDIDKAISEYIRVINIDDSKEDNYYKIAVLFNDIDKKTEARQVLAEVLDKKPEYYKASIFLGDLLYESEQYKKALEVYTDALKYRPNDYTLYYNMGMTYIRLNDFSNAETCYKRAAEINTKLYKGYYTLGQLNLLANEIEKAEQYFLEAIDGEEVEAESYYELAKINILKGNKDLAINFLNKAIEINDEYVKIAKKEPIFIPIKQYIKKPQIEEDMDIDNDRKELEAREVEISQKLQEDIDISQKIGFKMAMQKYEDYDDKKEDNQKKKKRNQKEKTDKE